MDGADIKYETQVSDIYGRSATNNSNTVRVKTTNGQVLNFDELVITTPLGWLKQNTKAFHPPLPDRLSQAIQNIGYGSLEKVHTTLHPTNSMLTPTGLHFLSQTFLARPQPRRPPPLQRLLPMALTNLRPHIKPQPMEQRSR